MRQYKPVAVLGTALLCAGCAATSEHTVDDGPSAVTTSEQFAALPATPPDATAATATAGGAAISPDLIVDLNEQPATVYSEIVCRQMLKPNSNVVINRCLTRPDWKIYDREEARWAQDTLLRMQGLFR